MQASSEKIYAILTAVKLLTIAGVELSHEFKCTILDRGMDLARCAEDAGDLASSAKGLQAIASHLEGMSFASEAPGGELSS